jgi:translation initiation factor 3 subunit D
MESKTSSTRATFSLPNVGVNDQGWGPREDMYPSEFRGLEKIFTHFDKNEYLRPMVADFTRTWHRMNKHKSNENNNTLAFKHAEEEGFNIVDNVKSAKQKHNSRRVFGRGRRFNNRGLNLMANKGGDLKKIKRQKAVSRFDRRREKMRNRGLRRHDKRHNDNSVRQASIRVEADWEVVEKFDLKSFEKMRLRKKMVDSQGNPVLNKKGKQKEVYADRAPEAVDLESGWMGYLDYYNEDYERIDTKHPKTLQLTDRGFFYVTTQDDDVLQHCFKQGIGNVYGTDAILAHLMACQRSIYSWDVVVKKVGKTVLFDKRSDSNIDYLTVSETAYQPPDPEDKMEINRPIKLSEEATRINQNFSQQVLLRGEANRKEFDHPNPFIDDSDDSDEEGEEKPKLASTAYRYRKWVVDDEITLVARTELHGIRRVRGRPDRLMTTYALNEYNPAIAGGSDWRRKLDKQRGAVFATELKNNAGKLWKWTAQTLLAGADTMKLGYVTRRKANGADSHIILGTQFYKPKLLADQINLLQLNIWGVLQALVRTIRAQVDGKFVIHKDPNKAVLMIYRVPVDSFPDDSSSSSDSSSDSSDDDDEKDKGSEAAATAATAATAEGTKP